MDYKVDGIITEIPKCLNHCSSPGHATIITPHEKLSHYLSLLTNQIPIESNFVGNLADNLNAEVALGTISNIDEAVRWLSYTYLHVRMRINPREYGISFDEVINLIN